MGCSCCHSAAIAAQGCDPPPKVATHDDVGGQSSSPSFIVKIEQEDRALEAGCLAHVEAEGNGRDAGDASSETTCPTECGGSGQGNSKISRNQVNNEQDATFIKALADSFCDSNSSRPSKNANSRSTREESCCKDGTTGKSRSTDVSNRSNVTEGYFDDCHTTAINAENIKTDVKETCVNDCSSTLQPSTSAVSTEKPECCRSKPSPCCDYSCLDRLALRECRAASDEPWAKVTKPGRMNAENPSFIGHWEKEALS